MKMANLLKTVLAGFLFWGCVASLGAQSEDEFDVMQNRDGTLTITKFKMTHYTFRAEIVIPSRLYGLDVTAIGEGAFGGVWGDENNRIRTVILPEKLKRIDSSAFSNNALTDIVFPETLEEIGDGAFLGNELTEVNLPSRVKTISWEAFARNNIRNLVIPNGVTSIEREAFANNPIYSLTIPASVESLGYCAFENSNIKKIEIHGNNRKDINFNVFGFEEPDFIAIIIDANVQWDIPLGEGFWNFYNSQGRKAGIYIKRGPIWTIGTQAEFDQIK